jgi:hypothetical protein
MKFTRANLFIVRTDAFSRAGQNHGLPNSNGAPRPNATRVRNIRSPSGRLAANWHVCPQTRRLECSWSFEALSSGDLVMSLRTWDHAKAALWANALASSFDAPSSPQPISIVTNS